MAEEQAGGAARAAMLHLACRRGRGPRRRRVLARSAQGLYGGTSTQVGKIF